MNRSAQSTVGRLICDEATARRLADLLSERLSGELDLAETAIAAFEGADGQWNLEIHFDAAAAEAAIRQLIAEVVGDAGRVSFEEIAARDWVAASLADLKPVIAGRFTVHGAHDRARIAPNGLGIQIEAALAFGTGHHGTTRGCLLALDGLLKARRPRRILDVGTGTGVLAI